MKTGKAIVDHITNIADGISYELAMREGMSDARQMALTIELKALTDIKDWAMAPVPFDRDLMGSSEDKEETR